MHNDISLGREGQSHWLKQAWPWVICFIGAIFYCYEYILRIVPSTMVPELQSAFGSHGIELDATQIGNLSAFYYYAYSPLQLPVGLLMDRYGPRWILTFAAACCALGALVFGITNQLVVAQLGRFLMGFGSAFAFVGVLKLASSWLPPNRFAFMAGLTTAMSMFCAMFGTTFIKELNDSVGWQQTTMYLACIGLILVPIIWFMVRDEPKGTHSPDSDSYHVSYATLFKEIGVSFKNWQLWLNGLIGCFLMAPTVIFAELWGNQYLESVHGFTSLEAPKAVGMVFFGWAIGGPVMGFFSDFISRRRLPLMIGSFGTFLVLAIFVFSNTLTVPQIFTLLFLMGFFSSSEIIVFAVGRENCHPDLAGTVIAVTNFIVVLGALFQVLAGTILDTYWSGVIIEGKFVYSAQENKMAMILLPLCSFVAFFLCFFLRETYCRQQHRD